ncbi:DUF2092 domain-containing protein [Streptomyces sp. NPDC001985]|uniref:LolA family protein n=1 Tax=Streptomyces sp. NPDC001985 TaxID=3154406 RepID=UPI003324BB0E
MAPNDSALTTEEDRDRGPVRRKAARYFVPVAVAGVAAATIGLVPALAASGDPDLPEISAQELVEKIAASDTEQLSGTVRITTDLGLPLDGLGDLGGLGDNFTPKGGAEEGGETSAAAPEEKLMRLATGSHTLRVAVDGPDRQKLSILEDNAEYSIIRDGAEVWAYDSASNEAYHAKKDGARAHERGKADGKDLSVTPKELADQVLKAAAGSSTSVTVDGTAQVAGRDAYQLAVRPQQSGSTIGSIKIAVDASTGTPLKFSVNPASGGKAAVDVRFTKVDFSRPAGSTFDFTPPKGTKVTEAGQEGRAGKDGPAGPGEQRLKELEKELGKDLEKDLGKLEKHAGGPGGLPGGGLNVIGEDWTSIAVFDAPGGAASGAAKGADGDVPAEAKNFLDSLGDQVSGDFGTGTIFKTRLVNALMTDDGKVYAGAVTQDALVKAANADK